MIDPCPPHRRIPVIVEEGGDVVDGEERNEKNASENQSIVGDDGEKRAVVVDELNLPTRTTATVTARIPKNCPQPMELTRKKKQVVVPWMMKTAWILKSDGTSIANDAKRNGNTGVGEMRKMICHPCRPNRKHETSKGLPKINHSNNNNNKTTTTNKRNSNVMHV